MRRARAAMSRTWACAGSAFVLATLAGAPPAGASDDSSTLTSVMSLFGVGSQEQEKIVYRERSKLVLPPGGRGLPEPQNHDGARPTAWPVDQEVARTRGGETPAPQAGRNDNPSDPSRPTRGVGCLLGDTEGPCARGGSGAHEKTRGAGEPSTRAFLTEPPVAYRERVAGGKGVPDAEKSSDWWNPGALIGRVFGN